MPFEFHPPTRKTCEICRKLNGNLSPIVDTRRGKASAANNFPFHNWYNFVLGYTPEFPDYIIQREIITPKHFVVDPFLGSGTTIICCKQKNIPSAGIEANDFFAFAAKVKLTWSIDTNILYEYQAKITNALKKKFDKYNWPSEKQLLPWIEKGYLDPQEYAKKNRPKLLVEKYISDAPFAKLSLIKDVLEKTQWPETGVKDFFSLAYSATILPASNIQYGPGFGVGKPKFDIDVLNIFNQRLTRMISDIEEIQKQRSIKTKSKVLLGDARQLSKHFQSNSVDFMITSPPYPGDHEYTKHSRLELILNDFANSLEQFRIIKQRMLRGSTTNIYKTDREGEFVKDIRDITKIVSLIDERLKEDGATSGFEKLYTKLIWEYFGGMYLVFLEAMKILKPGGKFFLLVSDSHAFKMVHIKTAHILQTLAEKIGFKNCHIELWQCKTTTSHAYKLLENILTIEKAR